MQYLRKYQKHAFEGIFTMDGPPWLRKLSSFLGVIDDGLLPTAVVMLSFQYLIIGIALLIVGLVALLRSY